MTVAQQAAPAAGLDRVGEAQAPAPGPARTPRRRIQLGPALLLLPSVALLAVIIGWPLIQLFVMSFQEYGRAQVFGAPPEFVGFQNYADILSDQNFWAVLGRSVVFCIVNVVLTIVLGTSIALLMQRLGRGLRILVSVGLLFAWAMPALSATIVWGWLFDTQYGVINYVLSQLPGVDLIGHSWLANPVSFMAVATVIVTWGAIPFVAFTIFAGLTQVPDEVLEAAQLDGTTGFQRFRMITAPYIRSVFLVVIILSVIWDMRVFTQIYALQKIGGRANETSTVGVYIYSEALGGGNYGTAGAIAVILVLLLMGVAYAYIRNSLKEEEK
ncbi:carbohydrate ABC transporter permease [Homoserinibacter sp. YIM 151385]|uniref:carbohydrate ABC transporter permease n=1 Tax=Homoserinibacter sp. YIM 151385 TaxID=2985506 RepID=UPI0022F09867|nr:sugar ABC transporter permease [Homoserinibacter sp. YIM 151385]WBU36773.1 sugar ABC transporter permease [Homoserinibacter sp. YIM 151385]